MAEILSKNSQNFGKTLPKHHLMEKLLTNLAPMKVNKSIQTDCYPICCRNKFHKKQPQPQQPQPQQPQPQQQQHEKFVNLMINLREKIGDHPKPVNTDNEWCASDRSYDERFVKFPKETKSAMEILLEKRKFGRNRQQYLKYDRYY